MIREVVHCMRLHCRLLAIIACAGACAPAVQSRSSFTIHSQSLREDRLINVFVPHGRSEMALPVLYMPDGGIDEDFPHVVATVDSLITAGSIRPVIVVGIPNTQRRRDLTGPTRIASDSAVAPRVGGSAAFREFIERELVPAIERRHATTAERGIIGESFAGLFIVETFLLRPGLFQHHIALDPSLWWNGGALIADARPGSIATGADWSLYLASSREPSIANETARLAGILRAAALPGLRWTYRPREDLEHATIFRALKAEALMHAFPRVLP